MPATQKWDKFVEELQTFIESKIAHIGKTCKDKWNKLNSNFKKFSNYHIEIGQHTSL
jgi:hypothetical protein